MKRRVVSSFRELMDPSFIPIYEDIKPKKIPRSLTKFLDKDLGPGKYIKGDPESKGKRESRIEKELEEFFDTIPFCAWWNMKIKGEPQSTKSGEIVRKASKNRGFPDYLLSLRGLFVGVEAKACGRYQSTYQIRQEEKVKKRGQGYYFLVTSVRELKTLFTEHNIPWSPINGAKR
jgi:hypothetical protein